MTECVIWTGAVWADGYPRIREGGRQWRGNRLVLTKKLGREIAPGLCALHTCDNPLCMHEDHIYEGTHQQNTEDKMSRGRFRRGDSLPPLLRGEDQPGAKLTERKVAAIRQMHSRGIPMVKIADAFGVTRGTVGNIIHRRSWAHI